MAMNNQMDNTPKKIKCRYKKREKWELLREEANELRKEASKLIMAAVNLELEANTLEEYNEDCKREYGV